MIASLLMRLWLSLWMQSLPLGGIPVGGGGGCGSIAYDATGTTSTTTLGSGTTINWTHTVGAGLTCGVLIVGVQSTYTNNTGCSSSVNGAFSGPVAEKDDGATDYPVTTWILLNPTAGAHTITCNFSQTMPEIQGISISMSGVNQSTTVDNTATAYAASAPSGANPYISVAPVASNAWALDFFGFINYAATASSWTTRANLQPAAGAYTFMLNTTGPVSTSQTDTITTTFGGHAVNVAITLKP